jgi:hypothetical protein
MIRENSLCAVITGDLVRSSELEYRERESVISCLRESFRSTEELLQLHDDILLPFAIFRGDSFQIVITRPERALLLSLLLSAGLSLSGGEKDISARISIGIGTIDYVPASGNVGEADGVAFRLSGKMLDSMKQKGQVLLITTPDPVINMMLETQCAFFDLIAARWTAIQKELIMEKLSGLTQEEIAARHGKSQSTVSQGLKAAGFDAVKKFVSNYESLFGYPDIFLKSGRSGHS